MRQQQRIGAFSDEVPSAVGGVASFTTIRSDEEDADGVADLRGSFFLRKQGDQIVLDHIGAQRPVVGIRRAETGDEGCA